jgi:voltage-gated potassium channel
MSEPERPERAHEGLEDQRIELLEQVSAALERPMTVLAFVWLVLVVVDLTMGLSPLLNALNYTIWGLFVVQFVVEFLVAPRKGAYLRRNWLTAVSLVLPALRVIRVTRALRALRAVRGARLVRVVSSANRGMRTLGRVMGRRGLGYVVALTLVVNLLGAAGILAFERDEAGGAITSFGTALWWTAMTLTTMGSDYFPRTPEGRVLGLLLAVYGFAVFGYVTASIASLFVARDAEEEDGELAGARQIEALRTEVAALTRRVESLLEAQHRRG